MCKGSHSHFHWIWATKKIVCGLIMTWFWLWRIEKHDGVLSWKDLDAPLVLYPWWGIWDFLYVVSTVILTILHIWLSLLTYSLMKSTWNISLLTKYKIEGREDKIKWLKLRGKKKKKLKKQLNKRRQHPKFVKANKS